MQSNEGIPFDQYNFNLDLPNYENYELFFDQPKILNKYKKNYMKDEKKVTINYKKRLSCASTGI